VLTSVNPATGETVARYDAYDAAQTSAIIAEAAKAWRAWRAVAFVDRAAVLKEAAQLLRARTDELARLMAVEMGKPVAAGRGEAQKCAWVCDHYAEHAEDYLAEEVIATDAGRSLVRYEPLGVVLAVMPWNFPLWQVFRFAAPALMAGNVGLLKHASNVSGCALAIERIFADAGLPPAAFRALLVGSSQVAGIIDDPRVAAATLTGSEAAGRSVGAAAGKALKPSVLELGGSDAFIVLADADVAAAAGVGVLARTQNSGQSCIAAKRFIVVDSVHDAFLEAFTHEMAQLVMGDPLAESTQVGPQARVDLREELHAQVEASVRAGARLVLGGSKPAGPGAFYPPTILADARPGMPCFDEEVFGPVAAVTRASGTDEAIDLANTSSFGLGASLWTSDLVLAERLASRIEAGAVFVNGMVKSDPRLPFGGIKRSGYGRELGALGIREFVNAKTVWIA